MEIIAGDLRPAEWKPVRDKEWPKDGRAELVLETEGLDTGRLRLYCNGELLGQLPLPAKPPASLSAGVASTMRFSGVEDL